MLIFIHHSYQNKVKIHRRKLLRVLTLIHQIQKFAKLFFYFAEMDQGFPWVLAAKYLMSGIGCVIGILSAAMASFAMRELKESVGKGQVVRKISNLSTMESSRKTSHPVIIEEPSNLHIIEEQEQPLQQLMTITECTSNGIIETSFP